MSARAVRRSFITQQGAIFFAVAFVLLLLGFVRIDGMMAAIGLGMLLVLGIARWVGRVNLADLTAEIHAAGKWLCGESDANEIFVRADARVASTLRFTVSLAAPGKSCA